MDLPARYIDSLPWMGVQGNEGRWWERVRCQLPTKELGFGGEGVREIGGVTTIDFSQTHFAMCMYVSECVFSLGILLIYI